MSNHEAGTVIVQSGVPIPPIPHHGGRRPIYPFDSMEVEHSFFIAGANTNTINSAITRYKKSDKGHGKDFTIRSLAEVVPGQEDKGEQDGVRVWRTR
jgi:hypothetical protein